MLRYIDLPFSFVHTQKQPKKKKKKIPCRFVKIQKEVEKNMWIIMNVIFIKIAMSRYNSEAEEIHVYGLFYDNSTET